MDNGRWFIVVSLCLVNLATRSSRAQNATFSVEVSRINSVTVQGGHANHVTAEPGDVLKTKFFVRDWSPNGELLRAYQITLDQRGYTSGYEGTIQALDYDKTTAQGVANKANCYVDDMDPDYVFKGSQNFALADSVSPGHRFLGALIDGDDSRRAPQDGTKYYLGTVNLLVSQKARGPFTLRLIEDVRGSSLRDPDNKALMGVDFEPLQIDVVERTLRVLSSEPPSGSIDAGSRSWPGRTTSGGWNRFQLLCNMDAAGMTPADITIDDGSADPPHIKTITTNGSVATLELDRGIRNGVWTRITHGPSGTTTRLGFLPGDVNNDGVTNAEDIDVLINQVQGDRSLGLSQLDLDRDGVFGVADALRLIDLLEAPSAYRFRIAG